MSLYLSGVPSGGEGSSTPSCTARPRTDSLGRRGSIDSVSHEERVPNALSSYLDRVRLEEKRTGVSVWIEIVAYPDGHAAICREGAELFQLNGQKDLLAAIDYLFECASAAASRRSHDGSGNNP
jgi:hypothetical protein